MYSSYDEMSRMLSDPNANLFAPQSNSFDPSILQGFSGGLQQSPQTPPPTSPFKWTPWGNGPGEAKGFNFLGANAPAIGAGINGLAQLTGIYTGIKQLGLAKDSFKLQKEAYRTNLKNSTQAYNTQMQDRIAGRSYGSEEERQAALRAAQISTLGI